MNKYIIAGVIAIIIIIAGGVFLLKGNSQAPVTVTQANPSPTQSTGVTQQPSMSPSTSASAEQSGTNAVAYTENGFQPQTITIKVGQTVTWTNKDSDSLWVASNPHPTHTDYPGFDELKSMPTGGTYSFTFTKVGHWGYHNHLNPSQMGVVVVTQ